VLLIFQKRQWQRKKSFITWTRAGNNFERNNHCQRLTTSPSNSKILKFENKRSQNCFKKFWHLQIFALFN
jgi:hypothetical protein